VGGELDDRQSRGCREPVRRRSRFAATSKERRSTCRTHGPDEETLETDAAVIPDVPEVFLDWLLIRIKPGPDRNTIAVVESRTSDEGGSGSRS
jgi:hypothetical protein